MLFPSQEDPVLGLPQMSAVESMYLEQTACFVTGMREERKTRLGSPFHGYNPNNLRTFSTSTHILKAPPSLNSATLRAEL